MPPSFTFDCQECQFSTKDYTAWKNHLLTEGHQVQARERSKKWPLSAKTKAVVAFGVVSIRKVMIMKHFGELAFVSDFVFWKERQDFCIIQFLTSSFFKTFLTKKHSVNGSSIILRRREEITDEEWMSICPFLKLNHNVDLNANKSTNGNVQDKLPSTPSDNEGVDSNAVKRTVENGVNQQEVFAKVKDARRKELCYNDSLGKRKGIEQHISKNGLGSEADARSHTELDSPKFHQVPITDVKEGHKKIKRPKLVSISSEEVQKIVPLSNGSKDRRREDENGSGENIEMWDNISSEGRNSNELLYGDDYNNIGECSGKPVDKDITDIEAEVWNSQLDDLYSRNLMSMLDWSFRNHVKEKLTKLIQTKFPSCILIPYGAGSTAISSGHEREIFNMFADVSGNTAKKSDVSNPICMDITPETLKQLKSTIIQVLESAPLPLTCEVKYNYDPELVEADEIRFIFREDESPLNCRIQITNVVAVQSCRLVKFLCSLDHRVRPLLIVARNWSYHNKFVQSNPNPGTGKQHHHFHAAGIQWLVIYFLTRNKIIPSIAELQQHSNTPLIHRGVNIGFCSDTAVIGWNKTDNYDIDPETGNPSAKCILSLFKDMLEHFNTLGISQNIISVNVGEKIRKLKPLRLHHIFKDEAAIFETNKLLTTCAICVQHPLKLFVNMTKNVTYSVLADFKHACDATAHKLQLLLNGKLQNCNPVELLRPDSIASLNIDVSQPMAQVNNKSDKINEPIVVPRNDTIDPIPFLTDHEDHGKNKKYVFHRFDLNESFRLKSLQVTHPKMLEAVSNNLVEVWLKFLNDFNSIVWPVCYGVRLIPLNQQIPSSYTNARSKFKPFGIPFRGILVQPKVLEWVRGDRKEKVDSRHQGILLAKLALLPKDFSNSLTSTETDQQNSGEAFAFEFEIFVRLGEDDARWITSTTHATVAMKISNVTGRDRNKYQILKMMDMYTELLNAYSDQQLLLQKKFIRPDVVAEFFK